FSRDWSSDVCSSDLLTAGHLDRQLAEAKDAAEERLDDVDRLNTVKARLPMLTEQDSLALLDRFVGDAIRVEPPEEVAEAHRDKRSEERRVGKQREEW